MAKGNLKFTKRLRAATEALHEDRDLELIRCESGSLFSPVFRGTGYVWAKVMDADGLLVAERTVKDGEGGAPSDPVKLLIGVVVQSEEATSQTKPNPLGKASLGHIPNGVWVDLAGGGRRRIDRVLVVFVLPKGAAASQQAKYATAKRNVENAADFMPDALAVEVPRGESAATIAKTLRRVVRRFFKGPGRPST